MYNGGATAGTIQGAIDATPTGTSLLCLSCHDGVGALDAFGANSGLVGGNVIDSAFQVSEDMQSDHPISITYTATSLGGSALNDSEMQPLTNDFVWGNSSLGSGTVANLLEAGSDGIPRVQCNSCHDVHNTQSAGGAGSYLLRIDNGGSDLCLACHDK
jgi:predicted CXXCH cytochrome family protein